MRYQFHNGVKPNRCNGNMVLIKIVLMPLAISAVFISGFEQDFAFKETNDESTHYRSSSGK